MKYKAQIFIFILYGIIEIIEDLNKIKIILFIEPNNEIINDIELFKKTY